MTERASNNPDNQVTRRKIIGGGMMLGGMAASAAIPRAMAAASTGATPAPEPDVTETASTWEQPPAGAGPFAVSGVVPSLGVHADLKGDQSECGIGAVMPFSDRLWFISYVCCGPRKGSGVGLYYVDDTMTLHRHPASVSGTYANRLYHVESGQMIIGPHLIDADNNVRTIEDLVPYRLTATMTHLTDPKNKVYMLGMESHFFEVDVHTLKTRQLFELNKDLKLPAGMWPHYKGGYTSAGRVIVANNTYAEADSTRGESTGGRLAEWDGKGGWRIIESTAFNEVMEICGGVVAVGWDRASVLFNVLTGGQWKRYRLPKASHAYDHGHFTEWPRVREVETERFLVDAHGMFYELPRPVYGGQIWGLKPIAQHLRMVPDFCSWKGMLVLAGNQNTLVYGNRLNGEPQSNLWFGKTDDLWSFGKPQGWGGPWYETKVEAGQPSDAYLMTGFDQKCLHLAHDASEVVTFNVEVDFLGNGSFRRYAGLRVPAGGYGHHEFPAGFSAHWVRLVPDKACTATAQFVYT